MARKEVYKGVENVVPPNRVARWAGERISDIFISDIGISGKENLNRAFVLANENGSGVTFVGNHLSNADWYVFKRAMRLSGIEDPDGGIVPMLGIRLYKNPLTRVNAYAAPHVKIWPPTETPKNRIEEEKAKNMNMSALRAQRKVLDSGLNTLVFPQGGREKHEMTRTPEPQLSGFLDSGIILPFGMLADKILKKGQWFPRRNSASIAYGEPFKASELKETFKDLPKEQRRQETVFYVMTLVASLLPEDYRGIYSERVSTLSEKRQEVVLQEREEARIQ